MADSSPVVTSTPGTSRTKKTLIGCGLGCGAVILIFIIALVSFFAWLNRRGDVIQPTTLVSEDTIGYGAWEMSPDDEATVLFFLGAMDAAQRSPENLPDILKLIQNFNAKQNRQQYEELLPMTLAWTSVRSPGSEENAFLGTVSAAKLGNQLIVADMLFGFFADRRKLSESYRGERIYDFGRGDEDVRLAGFIRNGDLFFTADSATAQRAIDRMLDGASDVQATSQGLQDFLNNVPDSPIRVAFLNESGQADTLFSLMERSASLLEEMSSELAKGDTDEQSPTEETPQIQTETPEVQLDTAGARPFSDSDSGYDSVTAFSVHGDFDTPERLRLEWTFNCEVSGCAGTPIVANFERFVTRNEAVGLNYSLIVREQNSGLSIQLTSENLLDWMKVQRSKFDAVFENEFRSRSRRQRAQSP